MSVATVGSDVVTVTDQHYDASSLSQTVHLPQQTDLATLDTTTAATATTVTAQEEEVVAVPTYLQQLKCSILYSNMEERPNMILGYPLNIYRDDKGRLKMDLILDLTSYEGNEVAVVRDGAPGARDPKLLEKKHSLHYLGMQTYNTWLPIYVNAEHFTRARGMIENTLSVLARGAVNETVIHNKNPIKVPFKPSMALDVLPLLMNKMMFRMMTSPPYNRLSAILAYWRLLRLFLALLETYPSLQQALDARVQKFRQDPKYRRKETVPDVGAFFAESSCATVCALMDMKKEIAEEWFVRQIVWMFRNDKSPSSSSTVIRSQLMTVNNRPNYPLQSCFDATIVGNRLFALYWFVSLHVLDLSSPQNRRTQIEEMDQRWGFISDDQRNRLDQFIDNLELDLTCYSSLWPLIQMDDVFKTDEDVQKWLLRCERISFDCGYHGTTIPTRTSSGKNQQQRPHRGR